MKKEKIISKFLPRGSILLVILIILLFPLAFYFISVYYSNWSFKKTEKELFARVLPDTSWVEDKFPIYVIEGKNLSLINVDGTGHKNIFRAKEPIAECYFSPNGKYLLIVTKKEIIKLKLSSNQIDFVDSIKSLGVEGRTKGFISHIRWAPDNKKFLYYKYEQLSKYSSESGYYLFDCKDKERRILDITHGIGVVDAINIYWDFDSQNIYYSKFTTLNTKQGKPNYKLKIYRVPISTLKTELVKEFASNNWMLRPNLGQLKIKPKLFNSKRLSFKASVLGTNRWASKEGMRLGLDKDDYLYYEDSKRHKKRLFRIPRGLKGNIPLHSLRWIPGERYALMSYGYKCILILEPSTGKMGKLVDAYAFGWYEEPVNR